MSEIILQRFDDDDETNDSNSYSGITSMRFDGVYSPTHEKLILRSPADLTPGERLRRERYLRFLSLEEMADLLGVSASYLGSIERGQRSFSRNFLDKCHTKLNLSYNFLLEGEIFPNSSFTTFVRDSADSTAKQKMDAILGTCSEHEFNVCYHFIQTYLATERFKTGKKPGK